MSLKLNERYPGRFNNPTSGYPQGSFKNRTSPTAKDGSYLEKDWANDKEGFFQSLLAEAGVEPNGTVDMVGDSQLFGAAKLLFNPGRLIATRLITVSGTYTPTTGMAFCRIRGIGGGGGSGSTNATAAAQFAASSGGASGSFFETILTSAQIGSGISVTIGAGGIAAAPNGNGGNGGTTLLGSFVTAPGGGGGLVGAAVASTATASTIGGAPGGIATGATILNSDGVQGGQAIVITSSTLTGVGASTHFGVGGKQSIGGAVGTGFGSGASGVANVASTAAKPGVAGQPGVLFIEEFA